MQGEVAGFYIEYQNLLKDLSIYKQAKRWQANIPPHPVGSTAKENFDAVGKSSLPSGCACSAHHNEQFGGTFASNFGSSLQSIGHGSQDTCALEEGIKA